MGESARSAAFSRGYGDGLADARAGELRLVQVAPQAGVALRDDGPLGYADGYRCGYRWGLSHPAPSVALGAQS